MFTFAQDNIKRSKITHRNMAKIVTMGEIMLRLSTPGNSRFVQSDSFDVNYGGGEANVAVSLQNYGNEAFFISKIPAHEIGQAAINSLRRFGVHVSFVARGGDRSVRPRRMTSTSTPSSAMPTGSIGAASRLLCRRVLPNAWRRPASQPRKTALPSAATSITDTSYGRQRRHRK